METISQETSNLLKHPLIFFCPIRITSNNLNRVRVACTSRVVLKPKSLIHGEFQSSSVAMPHLRMKCKHCGHWNRFEVKKVFVEQPVSDAKVKAFIPMYLPLKAETCKKCGKSIAEPKELIRIMKPKT